MGPGGNLGRVAAYAAVSRPDGSSGQHRWSLRGSHLAHWQPSLTASGSAASSCSGIPVVPGLTRPPECPEMPADSAETRLVWKPESPESCSSCAQFSCVEVGHPIVEAHLIMNVVPAVWELVVVVRCLACRAISGSWVRIAPPPPVVIVLFPLKLSVPKRPKVPVC